MRWLSLMMAVAVGGAVGGCVSERPGPPEGGGGGPAYQAERRPDPYEARRHMAQALVSASRVNAAVVRDDWTEALTSLEALRGDLRLAARRGNLDQQTRVIALDGRAIAVARARERRSPAALAFTGELVRDLVAYHDAYAWGPAQAAADRAGGGGGAIPAPSVTIAPPPLPVATPLMDPIIP